ncbi:hypothetical protein F8M41_002171 [Gigaspora margarita]|uniref:Uncharacterized protein n=1 Tax=Gigaspora margarita TaxID=4874 RepID=A0A8H4A9G0_GIGMA|nr:hypothetical protein F8M41_002171 [Gigaspora margarita]
MSSEQPYPGYKELNSYLNERGNKSYWSFLLRYRDTIVAAVAPGISDDTQPHDLDTYWSRTFLNEAEILLNENDNDFNELKDQKEKIAVYESEILHLQRDLTAIQNWARLQDEGDNDDDDGDDGDIAGGSQTKRKRVISIDDDDDDMIIDTDERRKSKGKGRKVPVYEDDNASSSIQQNNDDNDMIDDYGDDGDNDDANNPTIASSTSTATATTTTTTTTPPPESPYNFRSNRKKTYDNVHVPKKRRTKKLLRQRQRIPSRPSPSYDNEDNDDSMDICTRCPVHCPV